MPRGETKALLAVGRVRRVVVEGASMLPALRPGDRLLVVPGRVRPGDVVALADPRAPERILVKRLVGHVTEGVLVAGDNAAASTDSRAFGPVPRALLRGRAWYRYAPPERAGRIGARAPRPASST